MTANTENIELRAFKDGKFITEFTDKDFDIYYESKKKTVNKMSLISKNSSSKVLGKKIKSKRLNRNFVLIFSLRSFSPKIFNAIDFFFQKIILKGDSLTIFTPRKNYNLKSAVLDKMPKKKIANQLKGLLNRDINSSNQRYISLMNNLIETVKGFSFGSGEASASSAEMALPRFREDLIALENIRHSQQKKIYKLLLSSGKKKGQNQIFLFYDREFIPCPSMKNVRILKETNAGRQDIISMISSLFEFYKRDSIFDTKDIKRKLDKINVVINSIFFKEDKISKSGSNLVEHSEDMFSFFTFLSKETGGSFDISSNLLMAFKNAIDHSENYYNIEFKFDEKMDRRKLFKIIPKDPKLKLIYRFVNK